MRKKLQNDPASTIYPVGFNFSDVKTISRMLANATKIERDIFGALVFLLIIGIIGSVTFFILDNVPFLFIMSLAVIGLSFLTAILVFYSVGNRDRSNQRKYYRLSNMQELNSAQAQALQLMVFSDYSAGAWNETLEYSPMANKVKAVNFFNFSFSDSDEIRKSLYKDWGIRNKEHYKQRVSELLSEGNEIERFLLKYIFQPGGINELSQLSGISKDKIESYLIQENGVDKLIWGFEIWRAIKLARTAYMAEYITEQEAWDDILTVSAYAHTLFDNLDDFIQNQILGLAVWSGDTEMMENEMMWYENYNKYCRFSYKFLPWKKQNVQLPSYMYNAYTDVRKKYEGNLTHPLSERSNDFIRQ